VGYNDLVCDYRKTSPLVTHQKRTEEDERNEVRDGNVKAALIALAGGVFVALLATHAGQHDQLPTLAGSAPVSRTTQSP